MAKDLNLCQFIGRLGKDPEIRYSNDGKAISNLSLACSDDYKDSSGNKVEQTNWIRVVAFGRLAEIIGEYVRKGSQIYVSGKQVTRKYQDKNGQDKFVTEIISSELQMLGGSNTGAGNGGSQQNQNSNVPPSSGGGNDFPELDIPF